jgi:hypothetical protein
MMFSIVPCNESVWFKVYIFNSKNNHQSGDCSPQCSIQNKIMKSINLDKWIKTKSYIWAQIFFIELVELCFDLLRRFEEFVSFRLFINLYFLKERKRNKINFKGCECWCVQKTENEEYQIVKFCQATGLPCLAYSEHNSNFISYDIQTKHENLWIPTCWSTANQSGCRTTQTRTRHL